MIKKMMLCLVVLFLLPHPVYANSELSTPIVIGERLPVLNELSVNVGTLSPTFDSIVLEYTVEVPNEVSEIVFDGTTDEGVEVFGLGAHPLAEGTNTITIFATRGEETTPYTIYVHREKGEIPPSEKPDNMPVLIDLTVNVETLNPTFDSNVLEYTVEVSNEVSEIVFDGTSNEGVEIFGLGAHPLAEGTNTITIFATRGEETTSYTIYVYREKGEIPSEQKPDTDETVDGSLGENVHTEAQTQTPVRPVTGMTVDGDVIVLSFLLILVGIGSLYKMKRYE